MIKFEVVVKEIVGWFGGWGKGVGCILLNTSNNIYSTVSCGEAAELCIKATTGI